jgi:hypothetical protein
MTTSINSGNNSGWLWDYTEIYSESLLANDTLEVIKNLSPISVLEDLEISDNLLNAITKTPRGMTLDFTKFEITNEEGYLTVLPNSISYNNPSVPNYSGTAITKIYPDNYWDKNWEHRFELTVNDMDEYVTQEMYRVRGPEYGADVQMVIIEGTAEGSPGKYYISLTTLIDGAASSMLDFGTKYYIQVIRIGNDIRLYVRTGSHEGPIWDDGDEILYVAYGGETSLANITLFEEGGAGT